MAVKMLFYPTKGGKRISQEVKPPTIVLAKKNGAKLGVIPNESLNFECNLNSENTIDFKVHKYYNGKKVGLWDKITNFKLIWCKEWDAWFEITIDITQSDDTTKSVSGTSIGEAELSAIKIFGLEANTEEDIDRDDYEPTVIYNSENKNASLLDKMIEKAPHYSIKHVDATIAPLQRTFTFDDTSIIDGFNDIGEEIGCIFILSQRSNVNGRPERGIYVYDLQSHCKDCGYRGEFTKICPECGSTRIDGGYGEYTNVFISNENLAKELTVSTKTDDVNICFKLEAGDELMTAAVASCNPNGSDYIWYIPQETRAEMSIGLKSKLSQYDTLYNNYMNNYQISIDSSLVTAYNALVTKYSTYKDDLEAITASSGFESLIGISYNAIDFRLFLNNVLMPTPEISDTTASEQASLLTSTSLASVGVANASNISKTTVELNVLSLAKAIVRPTYEVKIKTSSYNSSTHTWTGTFTVTNYSDEEDTATTAQITTLVTDDYETYINQKIEKVMNREDTDDLSVSGLFKKELIVNNGTYSGDFANELKKYGLKPLQSFHDSCQSCIDVMVEEGISDKSVWLSTQDNLYNSIYKDYYNKLKALEVEIKLRESEIATIDAVSDNINSIRADIQTNLNLKDYLGETYWKEFCAFRRESTYSNDNYISDGLTNSELIKNANLFLKEARKELIKSATAQHSISSSLNNLLVMPEFEAIKSQFDVGNWIVVKIDGTLYRLRLTSYSIDFDSPEDISVEFSDVVNIGNDITDIKSVLDKASSMATSYQSIERQVEKSGDTSKIVDGWFEKGLDATLTKIVNTADSQTMAFDKHGMLMRKYDEPTDSYFAEQLRIINSTIAITDDDWETTKTAIGKFFYIHPETGELKEAFGVNGETIIGKMIIGESLALYNSNNTLKFNGDGLSVTNGTNTFTVNPNANSLLSLLKGTTSLLAVDTSGNLSVKGAITATSLATGSKTSASTGSDGIYINSSGNLYAGSNNETKIYANGNINLGNGKLVYNGTSLTVDGAIKATTLSAGGKTSSTSASTGTYIASTGSIYVGDENQTIIYSTGLIKTKNLTVYGSNTNISCTIGDGIVFKNLETDMAFNLISFTKRITNDVTGSGTVDYTCAFDGQSIIFRRAGSGMASLMYLGDSVLNIDGNFQISNRLDVSGNATFAGKINTYKQITWGDSGDWVVGGYTSTDTGNTSIYLGAAQSSDISATIVRGKIVRLVSFDSGAVYLGSSGTTAVTSDETLKDLYEMDDRYISFFNNLNPVAYKYKVGHRSHLGFGAQSVEKALIDSGLTTEDFAGLLIDKDVEIGEDEVLSPDGATYFDKLYSLRYEEFIALNTMMIKQLQKEIRELKEQIRR